MIFRGKSGGHIPTGGMDGKAGTRRSLDLSIFGGGTTMKDSDLQAV